MMINLTYGEWLQQGDPTRAVRHLHALSNTPYYPKSSRCKRRDKTRDYRRKSWRRQPIKQ